jgi:hypothetical protein
LQEAEKLSSLVIQETGHGTFWVDKTALAEWLVGEVESDKFLRTGIFACSKYERSDGPR